MQVSSDTNWIKIIKHKFLQRINSETSIKQREDCISLISVFEMILSYNQANWNKFEISVLFDFFKTNQVFLVSHLDITPWDLSFYSSELISQNPQTFLSIRCVHSFARAVRNLLVFLIKYGHYQRVVRSTLWLYDLPE